MTLRVTFGVVALTVLVLFYVGPYRNTVSRYARWWCLALALYLISGILYLGDGTPVQVLANPSGNGVGVLGSACVWAGARSLRSKRTKAWLLGVAPTVVLVISLVDDPAHDIWTGGAAFLAAMAGLLALSTVDLWTLRRTRRARRHDEQRYDVALLCMAIVSGLVALFYTGRTICFLAVGPLDPMFAGVFGSGVTTLLTTVMLVVVTFSMSTLSHESSTWKLRTQAVRDPLTGVLNRTEFLRLAERVRTGTIGNPAEATLLVADLDGFKALNDGFGHAAGDQALIGFANACRATVGPEDLVGRLGGDEFALLLRDGRRAETTTAAISTAYLGGLDGRAAPTISFGIATMDATVSVEGTLAFADIALYRAKAAGRDRAIRYEVAAERLVQEVRPPLYPLSGRPNVVDQVCQTTAPVGTDT